MRTLSKVTASPFASLLRSAGFKATPARLALLELLDRHQKPLSMKAIAMQLRKQKIDLATLYRMINALAEAALIRRVDFQHDHAHYELATHQHHHHLICNNCHKVVDISGCDLSGVEAQARRIGKFATITQHSLEFFGLCSACNLKLHHKSKQKK